MMFCGVSQLYPDVKTFKMKLYALKLLVIGARKERMSTSTLHLHEYQLPDQFSKLVTKYEHSFSSFGHFSLAIAQPILQFQIL